MVSEAAAAVTPVAGGAVLTALPSALLGLARCFFEPVRILFPVAIGGIAGVTASAAGSGGAVCPSTAAGGAVIYLWLRWRFPSPVASSHRPGSSTGLPRFSRFWTRFFFRPLLVAPSLEAPQRGSACCYG